MRPRTPSTRAEQREIANRRAEARAPVLSGPATGRLLQPFVLRAGEGRTIRLADYRQRSNVVLVLHHGVACVACRAFLDALAGEAAGLSAEEAVVLAVGPDRPEAHLAHEGASRLPFPLLSDPDGQVARRERLPVPAVVVADRFGEIWAAWAAGPRHFFPSAAEIHDWLRFVEFQCRECEAPEWPPENASDR